jgi:hypothetical protein
MFCEVALIKQRLRQTNIELLSREWPPTHTRRVCLNDADRSVYKFRGNSETGTNTSDSGRGGCYKRVSAEVDIKHQCVRAFDENSFPLADGFVHENDAVNHVRPQSLRKSLHREIIV